MEMPNDSFLIGISKRTSFPNLQQQGIKQEQPMVVLVTQPEEHSHRIFSTKPMHLLTDALVIALLISLVFIVYNFSYKNQRDMMDFTFTWGPDRQKVVNGTFRLGVSMKVAGDNVTMVITANDDEYDDYDYVGLVFDTNRNGSIDSGDEPYGLYANNLTAPTILTDLGFLGWAQVRPIRGPQNVTFSPDVGYTFLVQFPFFHPGSLTDQPWFDPAAALREGVDNPLHICFHDESYDSAIAHSSGVSTRFTFYIPKGD